jgi:uncharacterized RDD family membrane protein YckC
VTQVLPARARSFQGLRAGFVSRALAGAIDGVAVTALTAGVVVGWSTLRSLGDRTFELSVPAFYGAFALGEVLLCLYLWVGWSTTGRSIGKQVMGLRVVNLRGELMRPGAALLRAVLSVVFPLGLLWSVISRYNRSVADVVLRTSVIYDWNVRVPTRAARRSVRRRGHDSYERSQGQHGPERLT